MAGGWRSYGEALAIHGDSFLGEIPAVLGGALLATTIAALVLGRRSPPSPAAALLAWIPIAVPGTSLGAALIEAWNRPVLDAVYGSAWILSIAGAARFFPIAYFALAAHLRTVPAALWESADLEPAGPWRRLLRVHIPLALPGLALAAGGVVLLSSGEVGAALLLAPPGIQPAPVAISAAFHYDVDLEVPAALCLFQALAVLFMIALIRIPARLVRGRSG